MAYVVISYDKDVAEFALSLKATLEYQGFSTWLDTQVLQMADEGYRAMVQEAISGCSALVAVLPSGAPESRLVRRERAYAERLGKPVFGITVGSDMTTLLQKLKAAVPASPAIPIPQPLPEGWGSVKRGSGETQEPPEFGFPRWIIVVLSLCLLILLFLFTRRDALMDLLQGVTPTIAVAAVATETPSVTPTATLHVIATIETSSPTATLTLTLPPTVIPSASPTSTATPTITLTPTPTLSQTVGPTSEPTIIPAGYNNREWTVVEREMEGLLMVYVPSGCFRANSNSAATAVETCVDAYWLGKTEVTNAQYAACVEAGNCSPPAELSSASRANYYDNPDFADYPVIHVTWEQANDYARWRQMRLPSQDEWQYAVQGPSDWIYPWGGAAPDGQLLNFNNAIGDTSKTGTYPGGASWVGALDMAGNVWEWTSTTVDGHRVVCGGAWNSYQGLVQATYIGSNAPDSSSDSIGFRVAAPAQN